MSAESVDAVDVISASLEGELDRAVYGEKLRQIRQSFSDSSRNVLIDCTKLAHISPMAVAALMRLREFIEAEGKSFRIVNVPPAIASILSRGGLEPDSILSTQRMAEIAPDAPAKAPESPASESKARLAPDPAPASDEPPARAPVQLKGREAADLVGEVERLKRDLALMEADLEASRDEAHAASGDREKAQALFVELRARVEAMREENKKLADEQEMIRQQSANALAPMREVQNRIRASLDQARVHAESLTMICRGVEEVLLTIGVSVPQSDVPSSEPPLSHLILSAMVKMDPEMGNLFKSLRDDLLAADEQLRRQAALFANLGEENGRVLFPVRPPRGSDAFTLPSPGDFPQPFPKRR